MTAHRALHDLHNAEYVISDPGNAGKLANVLDRSLAVVQLVTAGAETRTMGDPTRAGQRMALHFLTDGGDCVITFASAINRNGDTVLTLDTAGQVCDFIAIQDGTDGDGLPTHRWQILSGPAAAALTATLTALTHTAPGTPDYAIQDLTNSGGFGFVTKDEGNTVLSVVLNLQTRVTELEAALQAAGLLA